MYCKNLDSSDYYSQKIFKRIWELDFARGILIIVMILFHFFFDLKEIYDINWSPYGTTAMKIAGWIAAAGFICLAGINASFSRRNLLRGLDLLMLSIMISIVTFYMGQQYFINFGILHFLSVCILLGPIFLKQYKAFLLIIAVVSLLAGYFFTQINSNTDLFFVFGITSNNFYSADYFPIFPWIGFFIAGIIIGSTFYKKKRSLIKIRLPENPINVMGRYSIIIYLTHQPILLLLIHVVVNL